LRKTNPSSSDALLPPLPGGKSQSTLDYQRVPSPVAVKPSDYPRGHGISPHRHERAQLLYAASGLIQVRTPDGEWLVPPLRAVWVPAQTEHSVRMVTAVAMRSLFIDPSATPSAPVRCTVVEISPLMRELIMQAAREPVEALATRRSALLADLLLDEFARLPSLPLYLPLPREARLRRVCESILARPGQALTLEQWGHRAGASGRTLARLFVAETGLTYGAWLRQARLSAAIARLAQGVSVARVAAQLGYRSTSAFIAMFRRALGATPSRYTPRGE